MRKTASENKPGRQLIRNRDQKSRSRYGMARVCALVLSLVLLPALLLPGAARAEEARIVLTIGDTTYRAVPRMSGDDQLAIWKYLEEQLGVEFRLVYLSPEDYVPR